MFGFFKKDHVYPIGVDMGEDDIRLVQLANGQESVSLIAGRSETRPSDIEAGSAAWQRWAVEILRQVMANSGFQGKQVIAAIPANQVFIDHVKMPKITDVKLEDTIFSKIKHQLPFKPERNDTLIKCIPTDQDNALVMVAERKIIDRHLAIYEKVGIAIQSLGVWPVALTNCYTKFFGRRETDLKAIVMLLDIEPTCTNLVICRHKNLLFACSIPIGAKQLDDEKVVTRLVFELTTCRRHLISTYRNACIERLIFLSGQAVDVNICTTIAKQLEIQAQMGDCLAAVEVIDPHHTGIDRRNGDANVNWAIAFGLGLS